MIITKTREWFRHKRVVREWKREHQFYEESNGKRSMSQPDWRVK